jgi:hypothetical protein
MNKGKIENDGFINTKVPFFKGLVNILDNDVLINMDNDIQSIYNNWNDENIKGETDLKLKSKPVIRNKELLHNSLSFFSYTYYLCSGVKYCFSILMNLITTVCFIFGNIIIIIIIILFRFDNTFVSNIITCRCIYYCHIILNITVCEIIYRTYIFTSRHAPTSINVYAHRPHRTAHRRRLEHRPRTDHAPTAPRTRPRRAPTRINVYAHRATHRAAHTEPHTAPRTDPRTDRPRRRTRPRCAH